MREIVAKKITDTIKRLCIEANTSLPEDVVSAIKKAITKEKSPTGRDILRQLLVNAKTAWREKIALCQDTGLAFVFLSVGQEVQIINGNLTAAVNEGVRQAYESGNLRKSTVKDPITRCNNGDNSPAFIHTEMVPGESIKIQVLTKGGGAENCSAIKMFKPYSSKTEIDEFILETVKKAGANACPPIIAGIGIGGSFDQAPLLAKKALLREIGQPGCSKEKDTIAWEKHLLEMINKTGIGPMGLGGTTTALAVHIERQPCHISSLPVAVNIQCHSHRYKYAEI
ncbi:MAG: fumarate hydratase [bacterium]